MREQAAVSERVYCSELAQQAQAPLYGSAVQVELWLLIEYPRPWKPKALQDNDLPDPVKDNLADLPVKAAELGGVKLRVQFIKQASSADIVRPRIMLADGRTGQVQLVAGELDSYAAIAELRAEDLLSLKIPNGTFVAEPVYLVCTNGQRDLCCARFGLPLFEALRIEFGGRIWQTTHIGGHRYAPNLVCLPSGIVYGFVQPDEGAALVSAHDSGDLSLQHLRGRSCLPPAAQAAEYFMKSSTANSRLEGIPLAELSQSHDVTTARFADQAVSVREVALEEPIIASCDASPKAASIYEQVETVT